MMRMKLFSSAYKNGVEDSVNKWIDANRNDIYVVDYAFASTEKHYEVMVKYRETANVPYELFKRDVCNLF